jgi:hypothetical protein
MKKVLLPFLLLVVAACSMPVTQVRTVGANPSIIVQGAPEDAILILDGVRIGLASAYNGQPNALQIIPGTHTVSIISSNGNEISTQKIFVESEIKTINVP